MISVNLTIFVQLLLFLTFLWITNRFIFKPVLNILDERERGLDDDREGTREDRAKTKELTDHYQTEMNRARRDATKEIQAAVREAQAEGMAHVAARSTEAEAEVNTVRAEGQRAIEEERGRYGECVTGIVETVMERLRLKGTQG